MKLTPWQLDLIDYAIDVAIFDLENCKEDDAADLATDQQRLRLLHELKQDLQRKRGM